MLPGFPRLSKSSFVEIGGFETEPYLYSRPGEPDGGPYFDGRWYLKESGAQRDTGTVRSGSSSLVIGTADAGNGDGSRKGAIEIRFPAALIRGRRMQFSVDGYIRDTGAGVFMQWKTLNSGADRSTASEYTRDYMQNYGFVANQWKRYVMPCPQTAGTDPAKDILFYFSYYGFNTAHLDNWEFRTL